MRRFVAVCRNMQAQCSALWELSSNGLRKAKTPQQITVEGFSNKSLTMTYFHTGCSTIIGAESFHGPVRDGKG
ncbi:hypothetical protein, partial [Undibacterium sp.]|uniref:hypothetical protein n=1 Tax=Undibacterium sp. TaxID=1914977 RepID=UPI0025CEC871